MRRTDENFNTIRHSDELYALLRGAGFDPVDRKGMVFNPLLWSWSLSDRDLSVNYVTASLRRG